jgi:hypothetical protein
MKLHTNPTLYKQAIKFTSEQLGLPEIYIEKDYWLSMVLKSLYGQDLGQQIVFKGGTSLSKCFGLIERFSEDIDLALLKSPDDTSNQLTKKIKQISDLVSQVLPEIQVDGLTRKLGKNRKTVHSYSKEFQGDYGQVRDSIVIEATWLGNPDPYIEVSINSYIGMMMKGSDQEALIEEYQMQPFEVLAQDPRRTMCEKIMSLVRFSYSEEPVQNLKNKIRHIYDLHNLIEEPRYAEFLLTEDFSRMLQMVAQEDLGNYKNSEQWIGIHPKESMIFKSLDEIWDELERSYNGDFKHLVYGKLPEAEIVKASMKRIRSQLRDIKWELSQERIQENEQKRGPKLRL